MHHDTPRRHVFRQPTVIGTAVEATVKWYDPDRGFGFVQRQDGASDALLPAAIVGEAGHQTLPEGARVVVDIVEGRKGHQVTVLHSVDVSTANPPRQAGRGGDRGGDRFGSDRGFQRGGARFGDRGGDRGGAARSFGNDRGFQRSGDRDERPRGENRFGNAGPHGGDNRFQQDDRQARPRRGDVANGPTTNSDGTVKWFNEAKGFGFVAPEDGGKDIFIHVRALERSGVRGLAEGQKVRMTIHKGEKGPEVFSIETE